jgi:hypothetical protein
MNRNYLIYGGLGIGAIVGYLYLTSSNTSYSPNENETTASPPTQTPLLVPGGTPGGATGGAVSAGPDNSLQSMYTAMMNLGIRTSNNQTKVDLANIASQRQTVIAVTNSNNNRSFMEQFLRVAPSLRNAGIYSVTDQGGLSAATTVTPPRPNTAPRTGYTWRLVNNRWTQVRNTVTPTTPPRPTTAPRTGYTWRLVNNRWTQVRNTVTPTTPPRPTTSPRTGYAWRLVNNRWTQVRA